MAIKKKDSSSLGKVSSGVSFSVAGVKRMKRSIKDGLTSSTIGQEEEEKKLEKGLSAKEKKTFRRLVEKHKKAQMFRQKKANPGKAKALASKSTGSATGTAAKGISEAGTAVAKQTASSAVTAGGTAASAAATAGVSVVATATAKKLKQLREIAIKQTAESHRMTQQAREKLENAKEACKNSTGADAVLNFVNVCMCGVGALVATILATLMTAVLSILLLLIPMVLLLTVVVTIILVIFAVWQSENELGGMRIVQVAKQELSVSEENIGGAKYKDWYGMNADWCAMFVSWCANECGYIEDGIMPKAASVANMVSWYQEQGLYEDPSGYTPKAGDIVFFQNGMSHVGIVVSYDSDLKKIFTIEGNAGSSSVSPYHEGSQVSSMEYSIAYSAISGYGTPNYPDGEVIEIPEPYGTVYTYMGWQTITSPSSAQYKLREAAGMNFDENGFGKIGDRYVIACTTTFGEVGDYIDWELENGTILHAVVGDIKNQNDSGCNEYGHQNGACVIEFVVDKTSWYGTNKYPTNFHSEWNSRVIRAYKAGSYW